MATAEAVNKMLRETWPSAPVRCLELSKTEALASISLRDEDLRPGGYISGPTQFSVADAALWFLVSGASERPEPMALTSELSIRFLRPAIGKQLFARATLARAGRRTLVATISVWTDDEESLCATAQGTYALP